MTKKVEAPKPACVFCGEGMTCRCKFKKPPKGKWAGSLELYSTVECRTVAEILEEIAKYTSLSPERKAIFKFTIHYLKG